MRKCSLQAAKKKEFVCFIAVYSKMSYQLLGIKYNQGLIVLENYLKELNNWIFLNVKSCL